LMDVGDDDDGVSFEFFMVVIINPSAPEGI
jgi:hypothetical protein